MVAINELKITPIYDNMRQVITSYYVCCYTPRWLHSLGKWSEVTFMFNGTESECKDFIEQYNKCVVPENNLMLRKYKARRIVKKLKHKYD